MKIMLFIPTVGAGGAERVITLMANYWAEQGYSVVLLSLDDPLRTPFFSLHAKVTYQALDLIRPRKNYLAKGWRTLDQIRRVRRCIQKHRPTVLIAQLDIAIFLAVAATRGLSTKVIIYEGTNPYLSQTNPYLKKLNNVLYKLADHLVLQTHQIAKTFPNYLQKKISVIYNPIASPHSFLQPYDYAKNLKEKKIVSVGRLVYPKAFGILIRAFHVFSQKRKGWSLLIMGEGEERQSLETLCKELGIADQVSLPGSVKDPLNTVQACSMFVLSSRYEGLPNTLCEAMSIGMPVVATRCEFGPEELINSGENGLLVPVEDVEALASAFDTLADDPDYCQRIGTNARQITDSLNMDNIMHEWGTVIRKLTS